MEELKRIVCSGNFVILFLLVFLVNGFFYEKKQYSVDEEERIYGEDFDYAEMRKEMMQEYRKLYSDCIQMGEEERTVYFEKYQGEMKEGPDGIAAYLALESVRGQIQYQEEYVSRYDTIRENAETMLKSSLFEGKNTFLKKNVNKTVKDYGNIKDLQLKLCNREWLLSWTGQTEVNYFILLPVLYVVLQFFADRKNGLCHMVRSTANGRVVLALQRLGIFFGVSAGTVLILYGEILVLAGLNYGSVDLSVMLQSCPEFGSCVYPMTIAGFMGMVFIGKVCAVMLCGGLLWLLLLGIRKSSAAVIILGFLAAVEGTAYHSITDLSNLKFIKYCNLAAFFDIENIYSRYVNINILGTPVSACIVAWVTMGILLPVVLAAVLVWAANTRGGVGKAGILKGNGLFIRHTSLVLHEGYKLFYPLFGILILLLSGILAWNRLDYSKVYYSGEETYKNIFYREVRGKTEEEVERYISEAEEEIDDLLQEDQTNARAGYMQSALNVIINQKEYLAQLKQDRNIRGEYVNPLGYSMLIGENGKETVRNDMLLQLFLIAVLFGGYMAYENQSGMTGIVNSTAKKVRGMNRAKAVWIVCGTVIISVLFFLVELDNVTGRIGLADLDAAVQSLQYLEKVPVKITLWQYILAVWMGRTILLTAAGFLAAYCSSRCRSVRSGILVSVAVIMLPALLLGGFIL